MRLSEFQLLIRDEFGEQRGSWICHSHILGSLGLTTDVAIEQGCDLRAIWDQLCLDFDVPESRRLGKDNGRR